MNSKFAALMVFSLICAGAQAQEIDINPNARVSVAVSNSDPNYITINDDRIKGILATKGVVTEQRVTDAGGLVFATVHDKPFSLYVTTESGFTFSLHATPRRQAGLSLIVNNKAIRATPDAATWEAEQSGYSALISRLVSGFVNNDMPPGFVYTKNRRIPLSPSVLQAFAVREVSAWRGHRLRIVRLDVSNRSDARIELNERYFWSPGVMAVSFWPQLDVISPGVTVSAIVLVREEEAAREH
ncbi:type-F conjugative transfer system secretin TraK (plasmid) [Serratia marcescens]|uniref:TraK domain-containing protein n=1 Tax=Serratia marcescens TaxID=615 RepID=UPI0015D76999|nr:type-F conjugative transfer system secretin TraK [Serratia marcescens]QLJ63691.1 type-F conjugative transfer system secretin TraK [Serratia marcescens]